MIKNKYRITLYNSHWMEDFFIYDYPLLPNSGDIIKFKNNFLSSELFFIKERIFSNHNDGDLLNIELTGMMENDDHQTRLDWDRFKEKLIKPQNGFQIKLRPFDDYNLPDGNDESLDDDFESEIPLTPRDEDDDFETPILNL